MKNKSIWKENVKNKSLPSLEGNTNCDILIIGGGIAGLSTAYFLRNSGKKIVLIDKDKCCEGASSKNTGKLTFMQGLIYHKIEKNYSEKTARAYLNSQIEAINLAIKIINDNDIECNLTEEESYVFIENKKDINKLEKERNFYIKNDIKCEEINKLPINFPVETAIKTKGSYSFNPYKFLLGLKQILKDKVQIYENTRAISLENKKGYYLVKTDKNFIIECTHVVVATGYPFFIYPYFIPFKTKIEKSFIVASQIQTNTFQAINEGKHTISLNKYNEDQGYLIYCRRSHGVNTNLDVRDDKREITEEYKKYFDREVEYYFQNQDLMTYDYIPFIGSIDNNMYILTGFNKWGNTNGIIGGKLICDLILERKNEYLELFNPKRSISGLKIKNLFIYNITTMSRYALNKVKTNQNYYDEKVIIKYINGQKCGIYIDNNGKHIVSNICPHMKCNLVFNYVDKTWDCPCHASRFDIDGNVVHGPAVYNIGIEIKSDKS